MKTLLCCLLLLTAGWLNAKKQDSQADSLAKYLARVQIAQPAAPALSLGSIWVDSGRMASLSADYKAMTSGDLITVFVVQGELVIGETPLAEGELAVLEPETSVRLRALGDTRAMLLGGAHFPTPRFIWWNFVASSEERIERAKERWERRQFPPVPGETEFIPLPNY